MTDREPDPLWITADVAIPEALLDAHSSGRLVVFVGAGASVASPSDLPLFERLARDLADLARYPFQENVPLDYFLGSMPEDFELHRHVRQLIARPDSRPNSTHKAIVRLADSSGAIRIVTTNFDTHLTDAASSERVDLKDVWTGPAVPLGGDFSGIVHLHGSIRRPPGDLVVTDADFGRAYVTDAWAARFLLAMFSNFTVLFVGYSHDDPMMRYLALGLPSDSPRFVLTREDEALDLKWERLGLNVVAYPVVGNDHGALAAALEAWAVRARMGRLDHGSRMTEIVLAGPTAPPVDRDYLVWRLRTSEGARDFNSASSALSDDALIKWLEWMETFPPFMKMFAGGDEQEGSQVLADWFAGNLVAKSQLTSTAMRTVQKLGQTFNTRFFGTIVSAVDILDGEDPVAASRWRTLLATSIFGQTAPGNSDQLLPYDAHAKKVAFATLRAALRPHLLLRRRWASPTPPNETYPDAVLAWGTGHENLRDHLRVAVSESVPGDTSLRNLLEDALHSAYDLLDGFHGVRVWDRLSFSRSAIERHSQDRLLSEINVIVDALRDFGEKAVLERSYIIEDWWSSGRQLFQRLALHLLRTDKNRDPDAKVEWLLQRSSLYQEGLKHEIFLVLRDSAESMSPRLRARVLEAAIVGPDLPEEVPNRRYHVAYSIYNLLGWISESADNWSEARIKYEELAQEYPDFLPREHRDLDRLAGTVSWTAEGTGRDPAELLSALEADPTAVAKELLLVGDGEDLSTRGWHDRLFDVSGAVAARPEAGILLWDALDSDPAMLVPVGDDTGAQRRDEILASVVSAWADANVDGILSCVLDRVERINFAAAPEALARFLRQQIDRHVDDDESLPTARMRSVAEFLRRECLSDFEVGVHDRSAPEYLHLNAWPAYLSDYWVKEIDRRWRQNRDAWQGLNAREKSEIEGLLDDRLDASLATIPAVASQVFFLHSADPRFAADSLFPLFALPDPIAWRAYLYSARVGDRMLRDGFYDLLRDAWSFVHAFSRDLRRAFYDLVVKVATFSDVEFADRLALVDGNVIEDRGRHAKEFASTVVDWFVDLDVNSRGQLLEIWLQPYLERRVAGVPRRATVPELERWADLVAYAGQSVPAMIKLFDRQGIGLSDEDFFLEDAGLGFEEFPDEVVAFYVSRVENTDPGMYPRDRRILHLVDRVRALVGDDAAHRISEAAVRRGFRVGR